MGTGVGATVGEDVETKHCLWSLSQVQPAARQLCFWVIAPQEEQVLLLFNQMHSLSATQGFLFLKEPQDTVGDKVGGTVGARVGYNVGEEVGDDVTSIVGDDVGPCVGIDDGSGVGVSVISFIHAGIRHSCEYVLQGRLLSPP